MIKFILIGGEMKTLLIFALICIQGYSKELTGTVDRVIDGDTFKMSSNNEIYTIRLAGIDAPELKQDYGVESKKIVEGVFERVKDKIRVEYDVLDKYNRIIGDVYFTNKDDEEISLNEALVEGGFAWHYVKYSDSKELKEAQELAKSENKGLWKGDNPLSPWDFRLVKSLSKEQMAKLSQLYKEFTSKIESGMFDVSLKRLEAEYGDDVKEKDRAEWDSLSNEDRKKYLIEIGAGMDQFMALSNEEIKKYLSETGAEKEDPQADKKKRVHQQEREDVGRYQLFHAALTTPVDNTQNTEIQKVIFKIDTVTGDVWKYDMMYLTVGKDKAAYMINGWDSKIESWEDSFNTYRKADDGIRAMEAAGK